MIFIDKKISEELGCNVEGRLLCIVDAIAERRFQEARQEMEDLLSFLPIEAK